MLDIQSTTTIIREMIKLFDILMNEDHVTLYCIIFWLREELVQPWPIKSFSIYTPVSNIIGKQKSVLQFMFIVEGKFFNLM